jgi:hypothetical protein
MRLFGRNHDRLWLWPVAVAVAVAVAALGCNSSDVTRAVGARCASDRECDDVCLTGGDYPDGFCSLRCADDGDCPDNARCVREQGGTCLLKCENDNDCEFLGQKWDCQGAQNASGKVCRGD